MARSVVNREEREAHSVVYREECEAHSVVYREEREAHSVVYREEREARSVNIERCQNHWTALSLTCYSAIEWVELSSEGFCRVRFRNHCLLGV